MTHRAARWITAPQRLPWVVVGLIVTALVSGLVLAVLLMSQQALAAKQARLEARQQAVEVAQATVREAVHQSTCAALLRDAGEPDDPAAGTALGQRRIDDARGDYVREKCSAPLPPPPPRRRA